MAPPFSFGNWASQLQFGGPLMAAAQQQQQAPFNLNFGLGQMQNPMTGVPSMYDMSTWGSGAPMQLQMDPRWYTQPPAGSLPGDASTGPGPTLGSPPVPEGTLPVQSTLSNAARADMLMSDPQWNGVLSSDPTQMTGVAQGQTPQAAQGFQFGWNLPTASVMTQGIGALGQLGLGTWALIQGQNQFNEQMEMMNKNYANSLKSYNDALDQRIKGRNPGGHTQAQQDEFNRRKLTGE